MKRLGLGAAFLAWSWLVHTLVMQAGYSFWFGLAMQSLLMAGGADALWLGMADWAGRYI
jgi:hypothetical protein